MEVLIRKALVADIPELAELVEASVRGLSIGWYTDEQIERSVRTVFGIDRQLIDDGTYFVARLDGRSAGCGGWSKRNAIIGTSRHSGRDLRLLDPDTEAAKIRAFFVHPDAARLGIGRAILRRCEEEARENGFRRTEMIATLPGVPLYESCGYTRVEQIRVPVESDQELQCLIMRKELL